MNRFHRLDVLAAWYREYLSVNGYRPRTVADYTFELSFFRRFLERETYKKDIEEIDAELLRNYTSWLYTRECTPHTIHHKLAALRNFFTVLYEQHKLYINLTDALIMPRVNKSLPGTVLSEKEMADVFEYLESRTEKPVRSFNDALLVRDRAILEVLYSTGMRRNELLNLHIGDINAANGIITIREGKGGKDRVVPIGRIGIDTLDTYIRTARPRLAGIVTKDELFLNRWGGCLGQQGVKDIVTRIIERAGITKHVRVHDIRHTCATHLLDNGADIRYVQELLGHESLSSTQIYTHVSINKLKESHRKYHPREQGTLFNEQEENHGTGTDS
jgi:integrase/recombinase XerC